MDVHNVLPASVTKQLGDKIYDKRKNAALEVERLVKQMLARREEGKVVAVISLLRTGFLRHDNANNRKGGLIGLAATAMALSQYLESISGYLSELVPPILACFGDSDSRVRYYACEAMYNVSKVARHDILLYFNEIFDELSKLCADPDPSVKSGAETLDRLIKDIVTEQPCFDVDKFVPLLSERIYAGNPYVRQFLVSWISVLDSVPEIDMLAHLPKYLSGLFKILSDQNPEIRRMCQAVVDEFLHEIKEAADVDFPSMLQILSAYCSSEDFLSKFTAITWVDEFILLAKAEMLPHLATLLAAVLPCLKHVADSEGKRMRQIAVSANNRFMNLVQDTAETELQSVDLQPALQILCGLLQSQSIPTRYAALEWLVMLRTVAPKEMYMQADALTQQLLATMADDSHEVVRLGVQLISAMSVVKNDGSESAFQDSADTFFDRVMVGLLELFKQDSMLLSKGDSAIIRTLCKHLRPHRVYEAFAEIVVSTEDPVFAWTVVQNLNIILLTAAELAALREELKELQGDDIRALFCQLYRCWSHNPIATLSLCLLAQVYDHAADLLLEFGKLDVTMPFLVEVDRLIQLLESPIFTYLRLQLLQPRAYAHLIKCLFGLLMLLPQSSAYNTLKNRLDCIPAISIALGALDQGDSSAELKGNIGLDLPFEELLTHFHEMQQRQASTKDQGTAPGAAVAVMSSSSAAAANTSNNNGGTTPKRTQPQQQQQQPQQGKASDRR
ncbi:hypothetical protein PTSG_03767 [Salpingoeca rosetta]|uniref:Vacuolar protein 14 C-terminal Fig4-binding domain-containing protein n=1 Tax=Salpingoeca rosetta (strain ATCC 50818 / BSB-021) TaxID=946362 RepID=F2U5B5_SALR5|nr:uncharacterized protein PTSG_03767 [Salpingoeca rosetta]EGD83131.1 hypothetical protein PTSG_03767 [Salpingoeca rosetta]|eukprot:XP_004995495.1 hypothetical protein PTSG_03767 [Salpingoeca rosetta]